MANSTVSDLLGPRAFFATAPAMDLVCHSCPELLPNGECPHSQRPCGHHCNHSWHMDQCCWCLEMFGEEPNPVIPGNLERVVQEKIQFYQEAANHHFLRGDTTAAVLYLWHRDKLARGEYPQAWEVTTDG